MKKKFILVVIIVFAIVVSGAFVLTKCLKKNPNHEQVNVVKENDFKRPDMSSVNAFKSVLENNNISVISIIYT